jgi:hypothetical protein
MTPQSPSRAIALSTAGARPRDPAAARASVIAPSTVTEARGTVLEPLEPYQVRSDGGIAPPPTPPRDAGPGPGIRNDGGIASPIRNDGGIASPLPRGDGGLR